MENKILNKEELRDMAVDFIRNGDYNNAVKYLLMAIEAGNALACIDMVLEIKYQSPDYNYEPEILKAINDDKFGYYLDLGIKMGSLDCMFYKAREQVIGDGYIEFNAKEAYDTLIKLKELNYDTSDMDDDWSIDEYINVAIETIYRK